MSNRATTERKKRQKMRTGTQTHMVILGRIEFNRKKNYDWKYFERIKMKIYDWNSKNKNKN